MAKLSKPRPSFASTIRTDPESWNPPIQTSKSQTNSHQNMPPPLPRASITQNVPHTPSLQRGQEISAQGSVLSSGKKRNRRGSAKKKNKKHRDSFTEHNGSISTETTSSTQQKQQTQIVDERRSEIILDGHLLTTSQTGFKTVQDERHERTSKQHGNKTPPTRDAKRNIFKQRDATEEMSSQQVLLNQAIPSPFPLTDAHKSQEPEPIQMRMEMVDDLANFDHSNMDDGDMSPRLIPTSSISVEQQSVFEKEPEMFGVYAASDAESELEDKMEEVKTEKSEEENEAASAAEESNFRPENATSMVEENDISDENVMAVEEPTNSQKPQIMSDVTKLTAPKLGNGRFACPFATAYDCDKTFAKGSSAIRHADQHTKADKYKCTLCDKAWSRQDSYSRHMSKTHGKKIDKLRKPANNGMPTKLPHFPVLQNSNDDAVTTKRTTDHRPVQADEKSGDKLLRHEDIGISHEAEHAPVTSAEEETENIEASDNEAIREEPGNHVNTALPRTSPIQSQSPETEPAPGDTTIESPSFISAQPALIAVPSSNKLKRKVSSLSSRSRKMLPPKPRKRHRGQSSEQEGDIVGSQHSDVVASDSLDDISEPQDKDENKESEFPESDTDMRDVNQDNSPPEGDDEAPSPVKPTENQTPPKVLVVVPKLPKQTQTDKSMSHNGSVSNPRNQSRFSRPTEKSSSRNGTLDQFIERSEAKSSSVDATSSRVQQQSSGRLGSTGRGESSKSHAKRSQMREPQPRMDLVARKYAPNPKTGKENNDLDEADESGTDLENQPRATTVARRGLVGKGKDKSSLRNSHKKPSASQKTREESENDGDQDDNDTDSNSSEEDESTRQKQKSTSKSEPRRMAKTSQGKRTGRFSDEETAILHAWRDSFCDLHNLSVHEFNEMMIASTKRSVGGKEWQPYQNFITKREFLDEYYEQLPNRDRRAMVRFRERHFTNAEKGAWTAADDKELKRLVRECGSKWVEIAEIMGRTSDAVHQRWRHKLNSGEETAEGKWTDNETEELGRIVTDMAHTCGKDADESDLDIKWKVVSQKLGNGRTAQQCSNRWRITTHKRTEDGFVRVPHADRIPLLKAGPRTPSKMFRRLAPKERTKRRAMPRGQTKKMKSAEYVNESEDEIEDTAARSDDEEAVETRGEQVKEVSKATRDAEESTNSDADEPDSGEDRSASIKEETSSESAGEDEDTNAEQEDNVSGNEDTDVVHSHERTAESTSGRRRSHHTEELIVPVKRSREEVARSSQTPAKSKNPFKMSTPANGLSLTQLHANTQATSGTRPTTGKRSRVPDTEIRPERPSPVISMKQKPLSSPLDMLAQAAVEQQSEEYAERESDEDSEASSHSSNDSGEDYRSPATFTSAKSGQEGNSHEDFDELKEEESDEEDESTESDQEDRQPSQTLSNGFWDSINNMKNLLPFSQNSSSSQRPIGSSKQGRKSLMDALRGVPSKEESSDSE